MATERTQEQKQAVRDKAEGILEVIHREAIARGILENRPSNAAKNPNPLGYFTTGMVNFSPRPIRWQGEDGHTYSGNLSGQFNVNVINVRDVTGQAEKKAATIDVASMSKEAKRLLAEQLLADLE